jgi:hypothetical protein
LQLIGENYPPQKFKAIIAQVLSVVKLMIIVMIISGQNPFTFLNLPTPNIYNMAIQNKVCFFFMF